MRNLSKPILSSFNGKSIMDSLAINSFYSKHNAPQNAYDYAKVLVQIGAKEAAMHGNDPQVIREAGRYYANAVKATQKDIDYLHPVEIRDAKRDMNEWAFQGVKLMIMAAKRFEDYHAWESASKCYIKAVHTLARVKLDPDQRLDLCYHALKCLFVEYSIKSRSHNVRLLETLTIIAAHVYELKAEALGQKMDDAINDSAAAYNPQVKAWALEQAQFYSQAVTYYAADIQKDPKHPEVAKWKSMLANASEKKAESFANVASLYGRELSADPQHADALKWQAILSDATIQAVSDYANLNHPPLASKALQLVDESIFSLWEYQEAANGQLTGKQREGIESNIKKLCISENELLAKFPGLLDEPIEMLMHVI